jgi:solute carrier family 25, member 33/36
MGKRSFIKARCDVRAIVTNPFDVVKTRVQSDLFRHKHAQAAVRVLGNSSTVIMDASRTTHLLQTYGNVSHTKVFVWGSMS